MRKIARPTTIQWIQWLVIMACFIMYWFIPIGILLLWLKMRSDLKATLGVTAVLKAIAWLFVGVASLVLVIALFTDGFSENSPVPAFTVLLSCFVGLLIAASVANRKAILYQKLISIVVNDGITSIDEISQILNRPYEKVYRYLNRLINRKWLVNAYISEVKREIVFLDCAKEKKAKEREPEEYTIAYCKSCGAQKAVAVGKIDTCNFCGSKLRG